MRADEAWAIGQLGRLTLRGSTTRVAELHRGIAERAFGAVGPSVAPVKGVHDTVAGLAYGGGRLGLGAGARLVGGPAALGASGRGPGDDAAGRGALAVLNGAHGDAVEAGPPAAGAPAGRPRGGRGAAP